MNGPAGKAEVGSEFAGWVMTSTELAQLEAGDVPVRQLARAMLRHGAPGDARQQGANPAQPQSWRLFRHANRKGDGTAGKPSLPGGADE